MNPNIKYAILISILSFSYLQSISQKQIYAVIAGVSDYKYDNLDIDLNYCDDDAQSFYNLLSSSGVKAQNMILLTDSRASKQNILNSLHQVFSKASANDQVIFFFSGHGTQGSFVPYDYNGYSNTLLKHTDVKNQYKQCKAYNKLCIADACFSGSIKHHSTKSIEKSSAIDEKSGIVVMMSSRNNQTSREMPSLKNGAFTYYLVKGLKGNADKNNNKIITVSEMYYYTKEKVSAQTRNMQIPIIFGSFDKNMPILYLK